MTDLIFWSWANPEEVRGELTDMFCASNGVDLFSMKNIDMDTCSDFISFLVEFCLENMEHGLSTRKPLGKLAEDIDQYLYMCLLHRKCAICGRHADIHHADQIGIGGNRDTTNHAGRRAIALCREHHDEAHRRGVKTFFDLYHLPRGIRLSPYLCAQLGLNTTEG
jgi:hypothetical protein